MNVGPLSRISHPFIAELKRIVSMQEPTFRPILISLSELIKTDKSRVKDQDNVKRLHNQLSEVSDMIHTAFTFHGCVSEQNKVIVNPNQTDSRYKISHRDNVLSLLIGDYLLAQSSLDLANLRFPKVVELIAKAIEDYSDGEFLRLQLLESVEPQEQQKINEDVLIYAQSTCGSLLAHSCLSMALLAGYSNRDPGNLSDAVFQFGYHMGTAHRLSDLFYNRRLEHEDDFQVKFYNQFEKSHFEDAIRSHVDKASTVLMSLPKGRKKGNLLALLENIKKRS